MSCLPKDVCPKCLEDMGPIHKCSQIRRDSEIASTPGSEYWQCRLWRQRAIERRKQEAMKQVSLVENLLNACDVIESLMTRMDELDAKLKGETQ